MKINIQMDLDVVHAFQARMTRGSSYLGESQVEGSHLPMHTTYLSKQTCWSQVEETNVARDPLDLVLAFDVRRKRRNVLCLALLMC